MAKATKTDIPVTTMTDGIQLTLSMEEAQCLRDMLAHVGGDPISTRRRHVDAMANALTPFMGYSNPTTDLRGYMEFTH